MIKDSTTDDLVHVNVERLSRFVYEYNDFFWVHPQETTEEAKIVLAIKLILVQPNLCKS